MEELNKAKKALRKKSRGSRGYSGEWRTEDWVKEEDTLHTEVTQSLSACSSLVPELDLMSRTVHTELVSHQKHLSLQNKFNVWKSAASQCAENDSLLGRKNQSRSRYSYQLSVSRPESPTKEDYYAARLLGKNAKAVLFAQLLKDISRGETECVYEALDMLIDYKEESSSKTLTVSALTGDLRMKVKSMLDGESPTTQREFVDILQFIAQHHRLALKEINNPELSECLALVLEVTVLLFDSAWRFFTSEQSKADKTHRDHAIEAELQASKLLSSTVLELQTKLNKALDECKKQASVIDRLRSEKAALTELLSDKDDQIAQLKLPPNLKDFDRLLDDMTSYLAEAEDRQGSQAKMLETISEMLDTSRIGSEKKRKKRSPEGGKTPMTRGNASPSVQRIQGMTFARMASSVSSVEKKESTSPPMNKSRILLNVPETFGKREEDAQSLTSDPSEPQFAEEQAQTELTGETCDGLQRRKSPIAVPTNPLLKELEKVGKRQPPMSENATLRFVEQVVEEKLKLDVFREETNQPYDSLPDFLLSHLYTVSGLKSIVGKSLSGLLSGLEKLALSGHIYGQLLCRCLGVFECGSIPADLEVFLIKAQAAFCRVYPNHMKAMAEFGGSVPLVEVSDLLSLLFASRWESAGRVLSECCPTDLSEVDMVGVLLCGKLGKLGRDLKYFFVQVDTEKCGTITFKAFAEGLKNVLGIPLTSAKLDRFWSIFETDRLTFQHLSSLNFKDLTQKANSKVALVSRCQFLSAVIREHEYLRGLESERLLALFRRCDANGDGVLTLEEFRELVRMLDPQASPPSVVLLFRKTLDANDSEDDSSVDALDPQTFCKVAIDHGLGGAGKHGFDIALKDCPLILRQILERGNDKASGKSPAKKKAKKSL